MHNLVYQSFSKLFLIMGNRVKRIISACNVRNSLYASFLSYGFKKLGEERLKNFRRSIVAIDIRHNVRALLLNAQKDLLLMWVDDKATVDPERKSSEFWVTIGGGMKVGERESQTLAREISEETGLEGSIIEELAFYGEQTLLFHGFPTRLFEKFYLVSAGEGKLHLKNLTRHEQRIFRKLRWWPVQELLSTKAVFYPRSLANELCQILQGGRRPKEITL